MAKRLDQTVFIFYGWCLTLEIWATFPMFCNHRRSTVEAGELSYTSSLMKNSGIIFGIDEEKIVMKKAYLTLLAVLTNILLFAQEKTTKVDVDLNSGNGGSNWYASPWVWIVGAAVFILLLVALTSGSRDSSDRVVEKRTVIRDSDV
jgi:hypothetical protein